MNTKEPFSIQKRLKSFAFAFDGIKTFLTLEHNARLHALSAIIVVAAGLWLNITTYEWIAVVIAIAMVVVAEMINTALEQLTDMVSPEYNEKAKKVKDIAAGAVLLAVFAAATIGVFVFVKYLY